MIGDIPIPKGVGSQQELRQYVNAYKEAVKAAGYFGLIGR